MEGEEGGGLRLSKRFSDKEGEVDYKTKSGTAWSHSFLNQKPWHPLSYPNQRRKWIAEQTHANRERRAEEVSREYAQEQDFFRQTSLISKESREKVEMMKAVSFMYVRPPGYNAESAKAAEVADEVKNDEQGYSSQDLPADAPMPQNPMGEEKKKPRPKDVFGRSLPTEEEFEILKNAPRLDTGAPARVNPFAVEVRNVKCLRCGNHGHQSGDRECPLKDAIMPNEESRLKRDDPLTAIMAHADQGEPLKWELKQKPGLSPPRGGFKPDDPNQQIVAEDIFDEYGGFLNLEIPELLTNFSSSKHRKKKSRSSSKHKKSSKAMENEESSPYDTGKDRRKKKEKKHKTKVVHSEGSSSSDSELDNDRKTGKNKQSQSYDDPDSRRKHVSSSKDDFKRYHRSEMSSKRHYNSSSEDSEYCRNHRSKRRNYSSEDDSKRRYRVEKSRHKRSHSSPDSDINHRSKKSRQNRSNSSEDLKSNDHHHRNDRRRKNEGKHSNSIEDSESDRTHKHHRSEKRRERDPYVSEDESSSRPCRRRTEKRLEKHHVVDFESDRYRSKHHVEDLESDRYRSKHHRSKLK